MTTPAPPPSRTLIPLPAPIRRLFDLFPLITYPSTALPTSSPRVSAQPTLHIFTAPSTSSPDAPSFNPTCLSTQTYLRLCNIPFRTAAATNHASPTGQLPYLTPPGSRTALAPADRIHAWAEEFGQKPNGQDIEDPETKAFLALVEEGAVRDAWVCLRLPPPTSTG
jgi:metaxin